ncbi:hypothetical protein MKW92_037418, partial [Papaver armeniacum]
VSLAYEPLKSSHYKVICDWMMPPEQSTPRLRACQIEMYSSETDSWKLSGDVFFVSYSISNKSGVYWNGSLHWIDSLKLENHICFNVDQEELECHHTVLFFIQKKDRILNTLGSVEVDYILFQIMFWNLFMIFWR